MTPDNVPNERADAIFEALDASEAEEQAREVAADEDRVRRIERIREAVDPGDRG